MISISGVAFVDSKDFATFYCEEIMYQDFIWRLFSNSLFTCLTNF